MLTPAGGDRGGGALGLLVPLAHEDTDWTKARRTTYAVRQLIRYEYPAPVRHLRQRLMVIPPRRHADQVALVWGLDVSLPARRRDWQDRFGNLVIDLHIDVVDTGITFEAWSLIERSRPSDAAGPDRVPTPRAAVGSTWITPTPLTAADKALSAAADRLASEGGGHQVVAERICDWVYRNLTYRHDATSIHTPAATALSLGAGVCQDYAHIALALCRQCGIPARYVSGHLLGDGGSHAWIEVMVPDPDQPSSCRVVALDPTHNRRAGLSYLTIATGRDYADIAPTSGSYRASVSGTLSVRKQAALVAVVYGDD